MTNYIVLHTGSDPLATTIASLLDARHPGQTRAITLWDLQTARRWSHAQHDGQTKNELILRDGSEIDFTNAVVFNRITGVTVPSFANAKPEDRQYAIEETHALALSWLKALKCPVINPATHAGIAGPFMDQLGWLALAHKAGIPTPKVTFTSSVRRYPRPHLAPLLPHPLGQLEATLGEPPTMENITLAVVGNLVIGAHPITLREPMKALARLAKVDFLEITLNRVEGMNPRWVFLGANPTPFYVSDETALALLYHIESKATENQGVKP